MSRALTDSAQAPRRASEAGALPFSVWFKRPSSHSDYLSKRLKFQRSRADRSAGGHARHSSARRNVLRIGGRPIVGTLLLRLEPNWRALGVLATLLAIRVALEKCQAFRRQGDG